MRIAIDVDGGDRGAAVTMPAAALFLSKRTDAHLVLVGLESSLALVKKHVNAAHLARVTSLTATEVVGMDESPAITLKNKKNSSLRLALNAVKNGGADACVSAGNTGALMATARFVLKTLPGIDRPAIAGFFPTHSGHGREGDGGALVLDLGANVDCTAEHLRQFAIMGASLSSALTGNARPTVALLNIGEEDLKGTHELKAAAAMLRDADLPMEFVGFTEGDKIGRGDVDVIVTDGFSGNIALKTAEGTAKLVITLLANAFRSSALTRLGYLISRPALRALRGQLDPNTHNGAVFLGLNGIVVKSHGSATARGVANAIGVAHDLVVSDIARRIAVDLANFDAHRKPAPRPATEASAA